MARQRVAVVAEVLDGDPHPVRGRHRRQRVRVRLPPHAALQEAPVQELPARRLELVQVPARHGHRDHAGRFFLDGVDRHLVLEAARDRQAPAVDDDGAGGREPERQPPGHGQRVTHEGRAGQDLVRDRERDCQVGVEVDRPPGLVLHLATHVPVGRERGQEQQAEAGDGEHHARERRGQDDEFVPRAGGHLGGVAQDDGDDVHADEAEDGRSELTVQLDEAVLADGPFDRRYPRDQQQRDEQQDTCPTSPSRGRWR